MFVFAITVPFPTTVSQVFKHLTFNFHICYKSSSISDYQREMFNILVISRGKNPYKSPSKTRELSISLTTNDTTNQWIFPIAPTVKNLLAMHDTWVQSLGWEDPLEKVMAIHSCLENPMDRRFCNHRGGLQSMGSPRVGQDWATNTTTTNQRSYWDCIINRLLSNSPWHLLLRFTSLLFLSCSYSNGKSWE